MNQPTKCAIPTCDSPARSQKTGHCTKHDNRIRHTGNPFRTCTECGKDLPDSFGRRRRCDECQEKYTCSVDGCDRKPQGRGYCKMHWKKWRKYGDPLGKSNYKQIKNDCSIENCDRPYHSNGYCKYHGYRAEKYGDPLHQGPGRGVGRNRMETPSYAGMHKRLFYDRGRASQYKCVDCSYQAEEWSYDGGDKNEIHELVKGSVIAYTTNQNFYSPRCKRCHRKQDLSGYRSIGEKGEYTGVPEDYADWKREEIAKIKSKRKESRSKVRETDRGLSA